MENGIPHITPETPRNDGEQKDKRRRRRRGHPAPVRLEIESIQAGSTSEGAEKKPAKKSRKKRRAETAPATPERVTEDKKSAEKPETPAETSKKEDTKEAIKTPELEAAEALLVREAEKADHTFVIPEGVDEVELPLTTEKPMEAELFVSDRWRQPVQEQGEVATGEPAETNLAETEQPPETVEAGAPKPPEADDTDDDNSGATPPSAASRRRPPIAGGAGPTIVPPAGGNAVPPQSPPPGGGNLPPQNPNLPLFDPNIGPVAANVAAAPQPTIEYVPNRSGERRMLATGLLIGGLVEHIRHKRREKRMDRQHKQQVEKLKDQQEIAAANQRYETAKVGREKTGLERQIERLQKQKPASPAEAPASPARPERPPLAVPAERSSALTSKTANEFFKSASLGAAPEKPKAAAAEASTDEEEVELPDDRRVETSAWHRIEVDKQTGKAVENPTVAYGEEFQHEQHQERLRKEIEEVSVASDAVRQNYASLQANQPALSNSQQDSQKALPPPKETPAQKFQAKAQSSLSGTNPVDMVLWVILGIVIIAIIAAL